MRALISVSDKTGIVELARGLNELGIEIISTGGTAKKIREAGIKVKGRKRNNRISRMSWMAE